ncbi:MFS transporter, SP family, general alpha glucoside:H+ symporter [Fusarium oxysporum Fo47]|uniref:MFS transporter, SP family, general alpha glucoside:H+ symporter n=1 Tax=Fusarium oxysporum Fo47 TaxID=660027 RepID=W9L1R7_FUSOX|nr:MFS transporter, SP family, general alpha glucoside:H+ symporter [Fusarium oxysporum Fo47]
MKTSRYTLKDFYSQQYRHSSQSTSSKPVYSINSINHDDLLGYQTAEESADLKEGIDHCESTKGTVQDDLHEAQLVAEEERGTTFLKSVKQHRAAVAWSVLLSTAIIMEGYDMKLLDPSMPSQLLRSAGLSNGASFGSLIGLYLNGHVSERLGFQKALLLSLSLMTAAVFIPFFAPSVEVLLVGQICQGIHWGVFKTLTTAYAAEVCPVHLRGYLTTYVNVCWVIGQIPFAIQWIWPGPLIIATSFAPESPWWCVRKGRIADAKANLGRLVDSRTTSAKSLDNMVNLMEVTVNQEREARTGQHYLDCFRGVNRCRAIIAYCTCGTQILSGTGL